MAKAEQPAVAYDAADYNKVVSGCQLLAINMMKGSFEVKPEVHNPEHKRSLHYEADVESVKYSQEIGGLSGVFRFKIGARKERKVVLKGTADFIVIYRAPEDLNAEAAEAFCGHVGMLSAYPYFRAWAAQSAWCAGVELPPLPMLSTTGKPPKKPSAAEGSPEN